MAKGSTSTLSAPLHLLHRAAQRADSLFARHVGDVDLTPRQFAVLEAVSQADGLNQSAIVAATGIDRSSTADLVRRMVSMGLLQRRRTKRDARSYAVRLTREGRKALSSGERAARATNDALLSLIPSVHRAVFVDALKTMALGEREQRAQAPTTISRERDSGP